MSSEVYIRWEIKRTEKLHRDLKQQLALERQHQAELFQQLMGDIRNIREKISDVHSATGVHVTRTKATTTRISNVLNDRTESEEVSGFDERAVLSATIHEDGSASVKNFATIDWSAQLGDFEREATDAVKKMGYAQAIGARLNTAVISNEHDIEEKNHFVAYLNSLLDDKELDFDYFKTLVDRRFSQLNNFIEILEPNSVDDEVFEYYALCEMLRVKAKGLSRTEIKESIHRMTAQLMAKKQNEFVMQNLREVFVELGMSIEGEMELDGLSGYRVVDSRVSNCSVFMSPDGEGIIFETVAEVDPVATLSADKKARIEESAYKICGKHRAIIDRMRERGIIMHIECEERPRAESIRRQLKDTGRKLTRRKEQEQVLGG